LATSSGGVVVWLILAAAGLTVKGPGAGQAILLRARRRYIRSHALIRPRSAAENAPPWSVANLYFAICPALSPHPRWCKRRAMIQGRRHRGDSLLSEYCEQLGTVLDRRSPGFALITARQQAHHRMMEAKASDDAKTKFLANMSHELRTPVNGVLGMLELVR